ncbi:hypothetical protein [Caenispirillum salinarum]|uniref:hypothetical protein n=1 Tax=Caenispirillum salinarum TaxID=859058 RepID=UPI00384DC7B3
MSAITTGPFPAPASRLLPRLVRAAEQAAAVFAFAVAMTGRSEGNPQAMTDVMEAEFRRLKL